MIIGRPRIDFSSGAVGGAEASVGEMFDAQMEAMRLVENSTGRFEAMLEAYDARLRALTKATGEHVENPFRDNPGPVPDERTIGLAVGRDVERSYSELLDGIAARHPEHADVVEAARPEAVREYARGLARQAEARLADVSARASNVTFLTGLAAGGLVGSLLDPVNVVASILVGPFGPAGAGIKGLVWQGIKAGAANAAIETAIQPSVQAWRAEAGLSNGFDIAAANVIGAGLFGFTLDAGVRSAVRGVRRLAGRPYTGPAGDPNARPLDSLEGAAARARPGSLLARARDGDAEALRELARATGADEDAAVRGGLAALEAEGLSDSARPAGVSEAEHLHRLAEAVRAATETDQPPPGRAVSAPQTQRGELLEGLADSAPRPRENSVTQVEGKPVVFRQLDPRDVEADAQVFQFKSGGDAFGVTERLRGVRRWDPISSGKTVVFERADGQMIVADGHQRLGLAKRLLADPRRVGEEPRLDAFVFREADGWTPDDVRAYAALKNMKELSGSSVDMARVVRARPDLIDDSLPLSDGKLKEAMALSRLDPRAFEMVEGGVVRADFAALVGDRVDDPARHAGLLTDLNELGVSSIQQARLTLGQLLAIPTKTEVQENLFGAETFTRSLLPERVRVLDRVLKDLKNDKRVFGVLHAEAGRIEEEGNVLARGTNEERAQAAAQLAELVEALATRTGPVADLINDAAKSVAGGVRIGTAAKAVIARLTDILKRDGVAGLSAWRAAPEPERIDDPLGPDAQAQSDGLEPMFAITAFHGSPHRFDRFDISRIGTGEGHAAFGHGLYFAQNQKVAVFYRNALAGGQDNMRVDGEAFDPKNPQHLAARQLAEHGTRERAIDVLEQQESAAASRGQDDVAQLSRQAAEFLRTASDDDLPEFKAAGHIYEVRIDADEADLLDYDEMIGEFPDMLEKLLPLARRIHPDYSDNRLRRYLRGRTGAVFYDDLTVAMGGWPPRASEALKEAGVPGIIYHDGDSRALGEGTRNIVTFSDDIIEIVRRDGQPISRAERDEVMASLGSRPISFEPGTAAAPTPRLQAEMPEIRAEIDKIISRMLPREVKARVRQALTFGDLPERLRPAGVAPDRQFDGLADPYERVIYVSLNALDPVAATRHESVHMLRAMGLIPEEDWARLVGEVRRLNLRETLGIDAAYRDIYGRRYGGDQARLEAALDEEAVAEMVARRARGDNLGRPINTILDYVIRFLRAVRDMLGLRGFRTVQDVLEDIDTGRFARAETAKALDEAANMGAIGQAMFQLGGPDPAGTRARIEKALRDNNAGPELFDDIMAEFDRLMRDMGDAQQAAQETAKRLDAAAKLKKRQDLLQEKVWRGIERSLREFRDARGQPDPAFAMRALLEHHGEVNMPRGMLSLDGHRKAVLGQLMRGMDEALHEFRGSLATGAPRARARQDAVIDELFGIESGDQMAKTIAAAWQSATEAARQRYNAAGGNIAELDTWRVPQRMDPADLLAAGKDAFVRRTIDRLDLDQMRHPLSGGPLTRSDAEDMLRWIYDDRTTDGWLNRDVTAQRFGLGKIANQRGHHRVLKFKDAASYRAHMAEFGGGRSPHEIMVHHLESMAKDIAAMEVLGPNPEAMLVRIENFVMQQANLKAAGMPALFPDRREILGGQLRDPLSYARAMTRRARDMWAVYRGGIGVPENLALANFMSTVRNVTTGALLGSAQLSALGDVYLNKLARKFSGLPQTKVIGDIVRNIGSDRRAAAQAGLIVENYLNMLDTGGRNSMSVQGARWSQVFADRIMAFQGMKAWTEAGQKSFQGALMAEFANQAGKTFDALPQALRRTLTRYGMDARDWEILRGALPAQQDGQPGLFLRPADVADALIAAGAADTRLAERYGAMLMQESQFASPTGMLRARAFVTQGQKAGSLAGEGLRAFAQFKSFAVMMHMLHMERMAREFHLSGAMKGAGYAAGMLVAMALSGGLVLQLKELAFGRDPRDMTGAEFWGAALLQSGGLGIWGDFLTADESRFGGSLASTIVGPVFGGALPDALGAVQGALKGAVSGEETNTGREIAKLASRYTPGASLWYTRLAMDRLIFDRLQQALDPRAHESFRAQARWRQQKFGNKFWWRPGRPAPDRGPNLNAAFGGR